MNTLIRFIGQPFSNTSPNGSANRATDHGAHRTTHTGSNSRTSLSPSPATGGRVDCWGFFGQCLFCASGCLLQVQEIAFGLVRGAIP